VRRISLGSNLTRVAYGALLRAAKELAEAGTASFADTTPTFADLDPFMAEPEG